MLESEGGGRGIHAGYIGAPNAEITKKKKCKQQAHA